MSGFELAQSEAQFQAAVVEYAKLCGWRVQFHWKSFHSPAGFPDLCMVRGERVVFAELKTAKGRVSDAQEVWLCTLRATGKVEAYLWRPQSWPEIERVLSQ